MRVLGLEGTAWAASAAVVDAPTSVVAMETDAYAPDSGGIHPREAAEHMATGVPSVIEETLGAIDAESIDAVAFSRGPGLGPCLRIVATAARTVAQELSVPLVGVNHMVAHLEVGRLQSEFADPICLNASGANAHVLGHAGDRYRMLGETMDTGVGNAIDKFTRHLGWSHPGGPKVETRAVDGEYLDLPYVVKGMDFSFSGITSAAIQAIEDGEATADVCFSLQETIFAMLAEVSERALSLTGRDELVLGGGVGQNRRLQSMLRDMCAARNASMFVPEDRFLRDNAGMIGMLGALMFEAGHTVEIDESTIWADFRPDDVPVSWRTPRERDGVDPDTADRGAEATVSHQDGVLVKTRVPKEYRHTELDQRLRRERTAAEARLTSLARREGVPTPVITDIDLDRAAITFECVGTDDLRDAMTVERIETLGGHVARLHHAGIIHGDPTTRNVRVAPDESRLYLIDFGLGYHSGHVEDRAMDLHVARQSIEGTVIEPEPFHNALETGYQLAAEKVATDPAPVLARLREIGRRGRYRSTADS